MITAEIQQEFENIFVEKATSERWVKTLEQMLMDNISEPERASIEFEIDIWRLHIKRKTLRWMELVEEAYDNDIELPIKDKIIAERFNLLYLNKIT